MENNWKFLYLHFNFIHPAGKSFSGRMNPRKTDVDLNNFLPFPP
jgi:hypothetical protein